jgi:inosine-uridine nucleoside N-ribohydrolase
MKRRPVIIDCDTGTDDAIAIIAALGREEFDVRAIGAVCGNVDLPYTSKNTLNLVSALGFDIPVAKGAAMPLLRDLKKFRLSERPAPGGLATHSETGLGNVSLPDSAADFCPRNAIEIIHDEAVLHCGDLEIIATAPMTDLALALMVYPDLKEGLIKHIYFMGGAVNGGNSTSVAEFNIFFDPEAAKIVLNSGIEMTMVGLDVTLKAIVPDGVCKAIRDIGTPASDVVADLLDFMRMRRDKYGGEDTVMHDALAVAVACNPEIVTTRHYYVDVECAGKYTYGHTYVQRNSRLSDYVPNCHVAVDVDVDLFLRWLFESVGDCSPEKHRRPRGII